MRSQASTMTTCTCFRGERDDKSFGHLWSCPQYTPPSPRFSDTETNLRWRTNLSPHDFELVVTAERRAAVQRIIEDWPDGRDETFKDPDSDMAVGYRNGLLAGRIRLRRSLDEEAAR